MSYTNLLVPTDFSAISDVAIRTAADIARHTGAELTLLYVMDVPMGGDLTAMGTYAVEDATDRIYVLELLKINEQKLLDLRTRPELADLTIRTSVETGSIAGNILVYAEDHHIDLIVMGTEGKGGLAERLIGATTEKVVRSAKCPVLTVKGEYRPFRAEHVVFALAFDAEQAPAIQQLKQFQKVFASKLYLLHVNTPSHFTNSRDMRQWIDEFVRQHSLAHYATHVYDDVSEEDGILNFAEEMDADVIALATHGRTGLAHLLSGSVSEGVVHHASRPVITFHCKS